MFWVAFGSVKTSGTSKTTTVIQEDNKILNTLYGPDNKPLMYLMEKPITKIGFQAPEH